MDWRKNLRSMPLWRGGPNTRTLPAVLFTPPASEAADMAHLCVPQNQALGVCRGFVPDIQVCGTHGREDLVNATITSNAEEEGVCLESGGPGFDSHHRRGSFPWCSHTSGLKVGSPVAVLPGAWRYGVSAGTGEPRRQYAVAG